jgi:hypothetical protein
MVLLIALAFARDERMAVVVLPALEQGSVPSAMGPAVERGLVEGVSEIAGFRVLSLSEDAARALEDDPLCREQPACLEEHLPAAAELVVDPRVARRGGVLSVELRLLREGELSRRHASVVSLGDADDYARGECTLLLAGWARDERLYRLALRGSAEAKSSLKDRFPTSPWTLALD